MKNTVRGLKKMLIAQMFTIIATVISTVFNIFEMDNDLTTPQMIIGAVALFATFFSGVLEMIGIFILAKVNTVYLKAKIIVIISIVSILFIPLFRNYASSNSFVHFLYVFTAGLVSISDLIIAYYIIKGSRIAVAPYNEKLYYKANHIATVYSIVIILSLVIRNTEGVYDLLTTDSEVIILTVLIAVSAILEVSMFIVYMVFISKAIKTLSE